MNLIDSLFLKVRVVFNELKSIEGIRVIEFGLKFISGLNWVRHREHSFAIIYFHRVLKEPTLFCPDDWTLDNFDTLVTFLNKHFNIIPISTALKLQSQGCLPPRTVCLSFDDGYLDNYTIALPVLDRLGVKASFFIATDGTEKGYLWGDELAYTIQKTSKLTLMFKKREYALSNDEEKASSYLSLINSIKFMTNQERDESLEIITSQLGKISIPRLMMNKQQLLALSDAGNDIGAHTATHSILGRQSAQVAEQEINSSIDYLNKLLEKKIELFAYPNGHFPSDFNQEHEAMLIQAGLSVGLSTNDGGVRTQTRKTCIPRFMPHRKEINQFCLSLLKIAGE